MLRNVVNDAFRNVSNTQSNWIQSLLFPGMGRRKCKISVHISREK